MRLDKTQERKRRKDKTKLEKKTKLQIAQERIQSNEKASKVWENEKERKKVSLK